MSAGSHIAPVVDFRRGPRTCHQFAFYLSPVNLMNSSTDPSPVDSTDASTRDSPMSARSKLNRSYMGLRDVATCLDSSCALISWVISKHSSSSEEHMAWEAGTTPPGPRNLPSTRLLPASKLP
jgi:hypothetical protein